MVFTRMDHLIGHYFSSEIKPIEKSGNQKADSQIRHHRNGHEFNGSKRLINGGAHD